MNLPYLWLHFPIRDFETHWFVAGYSNNPLMKGSPHVATIKPNRQGTGWSNPSYFCDIGHGSKALTQILRWLNPKWRLAVESLAGPLVLHLGCHTYADVSQNKRIPEFTTIVVDWWNKVSKTIAIGGLNSQTKPHIWRFQSIWAAHFPWCSHWS